MSFLFGVNIAGAEGGKSLDSQHFVNYIHPPLAMIADFANAGCKVIRYPVKWERLQSSLGQTLIQSQVDLITARINAITNAGMVCVLDVHNYMRYKHEPSSVIDTPYVTKAHFANLWGQLANLYKGNASVWFNLMNEPYNVTQKVIYEAQQAAIDAIRATGATNKILVSVSNYSASRSADNAENLATLQKYVDPLNNLAVDLHQYFDNGLAGTGPSVIAYNTAMPYITDTTEALRNIGWQAFLGEFNAGQSGSESQEAITLMTDIVTHMRDNSDVWVGATLWSAGPWWVPNYHFRVTPTSLMFTMLLEIAETPTTAALPQAIMDKALCHLNPKDASTIIAHPSGTVQQIENKVNPLHNYGNTAPLKSVTLGQLNGKTSLSFNGQSQYLINETGLIDLNSDFEVMFFGQIKDNQDTRFFAAGNKANNKPMLRFGVLSGNQLRVFARTNSSAQTSLNANVGNFSDVPCVIRGAYSPNNNRAVEMSVNEGSPLTGNVTSSGNTAGVDHSSIGAALSESSEASFLEGLISEFFIFQPLTPSERQIVRDYLIANNS